MLLAVDVGNTQTHVGAFSRRRSRRALALPDRAGATGDELADRLAGLLALREIPLGDVEAIVVSSVVPPLGPSTRRSATATWKATACWSGPG